MKFATIICSAALVVIGSLVLVNAGHYGANQGALTHYGGGGCHGHGCYNRHQAQTHHGAYGPYHSYAVRPAVYGGHGLYTYNGYARHHPAPAAHYRGARSYNAAPAAKHYRGGYARHHNAGASYNNHHLGGYALKPVKAIALIHSAPAYHPQPYGHHGGHYRAARGAYGNGHGHGYGNGNGYGNHHQNQQFYGHGHGYSNEASHYGGARNHAARHSYGGSHGGNGGY